MNKEKIYIASCSFGKDSLAQVILAKIHNEPIDLVIYCEVMFDNKTSGEMPEHIKFINEVAIPTLEKWGYPVKIVRADTTFKDMFYRKRIRGKNIGKIIGFPIIGKCEVSKSLKVRVIEKFYKNNFKDKEIIQYIGIATDEQKRLLRLDNKSKISLLAKYNYTEQMALNLCKKYNLLSPIYEFTNRSGCFFCPNSKKSELFHLRQNHNHLWQELLNLQAEPNKCSGNRFKPNKNLFDFEKEFLEMEKNEV
nr:phosphoadenosine phosphosulfate reductase [uncultured Tyzzerella sp.]